MTKAELYEEFEKKCVPNYAKVIDPKTKCYSFYSIETKINCMIELANYMMGLMDNLDEIRPPRLIVIPAPNNTPSVVVYEYIPFGDHMIIRPYHLSLIISQLPGVGEYISYSYVDNSIYYTDTSIKELDTIQDNIIKRMFTEIILSK